MRNAASRRSNKATPITTISTTGMLLSDDTVTGEAVVDTLVEGSRLVLAVPVDVDELVEASVDVESVVVVVASPWTIRIDPTR
jgi:hypothetical protein